MCVRSNSVATFAQAPCSSAFHFVVCFGTRSGVSPACGDIAGGRAAHGAAEERAARKRPQRTQPSPAAAALEGCKHWSGAVASPAQHWRGAALEWCGPAQHRRSATLEWCGQQGSLGYRWRRYPRLGVAAVCHGGGTGCPYVRPAVHWSGASTGVVLAGRAPEWCPEGACTGVVLVLEWYVRVLGPALEGASTGVVRACQAPEGCKHWSGAGI